MDAHTPVETAAASRQLDAEVLAIQQKDVLRYVHANPGSTLGVIADAIGRDNSNLRKCLERLQREGLVSDKPYRLTDEGAGWLPRIDAFEGKGPTGLPPIPWLRIRINPENPRTKASLIDAEQDALAENIAARGLKQPILLKLDFDGTSGQLDDGWRRYEAIGRLIQRKDPRWPVTKPVPYHVNESDDAADRLADALLTGFHKKNLHPLEEAEGLAKLRGMGWTPRRIWDATGVSEKVYQQRLDLLNLTDPQRARMRLDKDDTGYLSTKGARLLLQHLRQIATGEQQDIESVAVKFDLSPKLQLALLEVAFAVEQKSDRGAVPILDQASGGALATLVERGLVKVDGGSGRWTVELPKAGQAIAWLNDVKFFDFPQATLSRVRCEVIGAGKDTYMIANRVYATDELNTDPLVYRGRRFPNATHLAEAKRLALGGGPSNSGGAPRAKPSALTVQEGEKLTAREHLIMIEVGYASGRTIAGAGVPVGAHWLDSGKDRLVADPFHYLAFRNDGGEGEPWRVHITDAGREYLWVAVGGHRGQAPSGLLLREARAAVVKPGWPGPEYVTRWLNPDGNAEQTAKPADPEEAPAPPETDIHEDEDEDAAGAEIFAKVVAGIASGDALRPDAGENRFTALLELTGIKGPFETTGVFKGLVWGAEAHCVCTVDVDGQINDDKAHAIALLIAFALNHCAG